jgi:hypothetical protein
VNKMSIDPKVKARALWLLTHLLPVRRGLDEMGRPRRPRENIPTRAVVLGRVRIASVDNIGEALAIAEDPFSLRGARRKANAFVVCATAAQDVPIFWGSMLWRKPISTQYGGHSLVCTLFDRTGHSENTRDADF